MLSIWTFPEKSESDMNIFKKVNVIEETAKTVQTR